MSTPFPLEEQAQTDTRGEALANPNAPRPPGVFGGWGFSQEEVPEGLNANTLNVVSPATPLLYKGVVKPGLSILASAERLLGTGLQGAGEAFDSGTPGPVDEEISKGLLSAGNRVDADARENLRKLTPDPATAGVALQAVHGLVKVGGEALLTGGAGVFALEGNERYSALRDQGVDRKTAAEIGVLTGAANAAGLKVPMSFGSTLATRLLSGGAANAAFGMINREADSQILRAGGYDEMADQEKPLDLAQTVIDAVIGTAFGGVSHLHARAAAEEQLDAAYTANLALRNRKAAPGVATDPQAAAAHVDALNKAVQDLQDGQHVNVAGTGIEDSTFLDRGGEPNHELTDILYQSLHESGLLDEQAKLQQLDEIFKAKTEGRAIESPDETDQHIATLPEGTRQKLVEMYREAADAKPGFDKQVGDLASELGAEAQTPGLKGTKRAVEKTMGDYDGDASKINDLLRATLIVPTGDKMMEAAQRVRDSFEVVKESNRAERPMADGYRDVMFKVRTANGHTAEVQINLPSMIAAKGKVHDLYEARSRIERKAQMEKRDLSEKQLKRVAELDAQMKTVYDEAWAEATKESHSSSDTGMPLRETEPGGNQRGPEGLSNARNPAPPSGLGMRATGSPSTSKSLEPGGRVAETPLRDMGNSPGGIIPQGEGKAGEETAVESSAREAVQERPDMEIATGEDKSTSAEGALAAADSNVARTEKDAPSMFKAAIDCFLRRGG